MKNQRIADDCLAQHNVFRRLHCVRELSVSRELQKSAQQWAEVLLHDTVIGASPVARNGEVGENIAARTSTQKNFTISGSDIAQQWYDGIKDYDFVTATGSGHSGNFTQLIWASTSEVGFGVGHKKGKYIVVAHYGPPGNVRDHYESNVFPLRDIASVPIDPADPVQLESVIVPTITFDSVMTGYTTGGPCVQTCPQTVVECSLGDVAAEEWSENLCLFKAPSWHLRSDSMSSDDNFELQLTGMPDLCKAKRRELRQFVRHTVANINKYRVLHGVPKLKHNKDLDELSQKWACEVSKQSKLTHSNNLYNEGKLGENIASRWSTAKVEYNADEVVEHFYNENQDYRFGEEPQDVGQFGNFTQMMWKSTKEVGVGKAYYSQADGYKVIIVCSFYPAGNVLGHFVENVIPLPT